MAALVGLTFLCLYAIGLRADRIHAQRACIESAEPAATTSLRSSSCPSDRPNESSRSVGPESSRRSLGVTGTIPSRGLYRHHSASYWAGRYRHRTRQLQQARHALKGALTNPRYTSPDEAAFLCIHGFEGPWNDPNPPHWGGVQMDLDFQRTYGDWALAAFGTADHWPISVQLAVAIRAKVSGRGFYPWPNTARACGLI